MVDTISIEVIIISMLLDTLIGNESRTAMFIVRLQAFPILEILAVKKLPESKRLIRCRCVARPQLMFQISNPFEGKLTLDGEGRPVSRRKGHGIGTRSILVILYPGIL